MTTRIILFLALLTYSIIVSQSFMYILALKHAQLGLNANSYIELRKLVDAGMRANSTYAVYAALLLNLLLVIFTFRNPGNLLFITAAAGFLALVVDVLLTLKGSLPINDVINTWSLDTYPADWQEYRTKWFNIYQYRQVVTIVGFVSLLAGGVFGTRHGNG